MVSYPDGPGLGHFRGSSSLESNRWCSSADLDYRLVRRDNGCSGRYFRLSFAQLARLRGCVETRTSSNTHALAMRLGGWRLTEDGIGPRRNDYSALTKIW